MSKRLLRSIQYAAWAAVALLSAILIVVIVDARDQRFGEWLARLQESIPGPLGRPESGRVTIGGPFTLIDQNGATVTEAALKAHPSLIYFGFTFCPDVCPTTLFDATNWMKALGPDADKLRFYFVTVDPERDTKEVIAEYLGAFDPRMIGLTGSRQAVDQALSSFRIYSRKVPDENGGGYTMDHNASVYMFDAEGRFAGAIAYQEPEDEVLPKLRKLIGSS